LYLYKGSDIEPLILLMQDEYNARYQLIAFPESKVCDRYSSMKDLAIQTAKDIHDTLIN